MFHRVVLDKCVHPCVLYKTGVSLCGNRGWMFSLCPCSPYTWLIDILGFRVSGNLGLPVVSPTPYNSEIPGPQHNNIAPTILKLQPIFRGSGLGFRDAFR